MLCWTDATQRGHVLLHTHTAQQSLCILFHSKWTITMAHRVAAVGIGCSGFERSAHVLVWHPDMDAVLLLPEVCMVAPLRLCIDAHYAPACTLSCVTLCAAWWLHFIKSHVSHTDLCLGIVTYNAGHWHGDCSATYRCFPVTAQLFNHQYSRLESGRCSRQAHHAADFFLLEPNLCASS